MSCLTSLCLDAVCPSFPQWCSTEHHSAAPTVWAGEVPWNDFRASTLCATWKKISHCTIVKNSTNPPDLSCCLRRALWEEDGEVGVQMEAFSLKAPLALSCSFTLFETHQLLEVKYSLCLFPEHLCSWLCTPMSPSAVYSCCPNISQHPSEMWDGSCPGTLECISSLLLYSPEFAFWLSWLHSSCTLSSWPPDWWSFAAGWRGGLVRYERGQNC